MAGNGNWIWQGRQYHMWFGHGTRPRDADPGFGDIPAALDERIRKLGMTAIAGLPARVRTHPNASFDRTRQAQLLKAMRRWVRHRSLSRRDFARVMFGMEPDAPGVRDFQDAALSLGEARLRADMRDAADELAAGMMAVGLDRFPRVLADAAARADMPVSGLLVPAQYQRFGGGPQRLPGGGWRELTPVERLLLARYRAALTRLRTLEPENRRWTETLEHPNALPSPEFVRNLEDEADRLFQRSLVPSLVPPGVAAGSSNTWSTPQFSFIGPEFSENVFGSRQTRGRVMVTGTLPLSRGQWVTPEMADGAPVPAQVAAQLIGRSFASFDSFREAFWRAVANVPELLEPFSPEQVARMRDGKAPEASADGHGGRRRVYELHHRPGIAENGPVYDLSNIRVVAPSRHIDLHRRKDSQ